jgi:hypothetical protein
MLVPEFILEHRLSCVATPCVVRLSSPLELPSPSRKGGEQPEGVGEGGAYMESTLSPIS